MRGKKWRAVVLVVVGIALAGLFTLYAIGVLVRLRPSFAACWYAGLAAGAVALIGLLVLSLGAMAKGNVHRWPILVLLGCVLGVVVGLRLVTIVSPGGKPFLAVMEGTVPHPPSAPSPRAFLVLAWVAFIATGLTVTTLGGVLGLALLLAPAPLRRAQLQWRARQRRRRRQRHHSVRQRPR